MKRKKIKSMLKPLLNNKLQSLSPNKISTIISIGKRLVNI